MLPSAFVSICRYCHQSASGTEVVDLPDVLPGLPEGQYLDMVDSESDLFGDLSDDELVEVPEMDTWLGNILLPLVVWNHCVWICPMVCLVVSTWPPFCGCHTLNVCYVMLRLRVY